MAESRDQNTAKSQLKSHDKGYKGTVAECFKRFILLFSQVYSNQGDRNGVIRLIHKTNFVKCQ